MSVAEIIEQIKALPKSEKQEVLTVLKEELEDDPAAAETGEISSNEVQEALAEIFAEYDEDFKMLAK